MISVFLDQWPFYIFSLDAEHEKLFGEKFFLKPDRSNGGEAFFNMVIKSYRTMVLINDKFGSADIADRVREYEPKILGQLEKLFFEDEETKFSFITHGDAWFNNFLFK